MFKRNGAALTSATTKRKRKGENVAIQYTPAASTSNEDTVFVQIPAVRMWNKRINAKGRYGGTRKTVLVLDTVSTEPAPLLPPVEDPNAEDATDWADMLGNGVQVKSKRSKRNDSTKMRDWLQHVRQTYLEELVRCDGLGDIEECAVCVTCNLALGTVRCMDCSNPAMACAGCMVNLHQRNPLHRVEASLYILHYIGNADGAQEWRDGHFQRTTLAGLGMIIHLGHEDSCPVPEPLKDAFVVFDMNGIHHLQLEYCGCSMGMHLERYQQLLRQRWYPATFDRPRTAFTFDVLDTYHKLTLQGKLNLYDFYHGILHKTDNCGRLKKIYRYHELARCVRQWRHLKLAKRGGSAHIASGVKGTPEGSLAVECPACPHPGRNTPASLDDVPPDKRWLHALYLAIDANFRLKLKARGIEDPELGSGWAYFVEQTEYEKHVREHFDEKELRGCGSTFHAVNDANSKFSKGYAVTGVAAAVCARHNFVQKNGVGDLQRGERQCNVDYVVLSTLKHEQHKNLKLSYDIACSWSKHVQERIETHYSVEMQLSDGVTIVFLIPKFHLPAHGPSCHSKYSFNFNRFVGRTHGETVEQEWSHINGAVLMTREMGAGARHGSLDDHWGGWNWMKLITLGDYLSKSLKKSATMKKKHRALANKLTSNFPPQTIADWQSMVDAWDENHNKPDPYEEPEHAVNQAEERRLMADEEAKEVGKGEHFPHKVTAAVFVRMGLDIEEQQRTLVIYVNRKVIRTTAEKAALQEKRNGLRRQIEKWRDIQLVYMPGVASLRGLDPDPDARSSTNEERPELAKLWLPSDVPTAHRASACLRGIVVKEKRFRAAQVHDALVELRRARRINRGVWNHFHIDVAGTGQRTITRTRTIIINSAKRIDRAFKRYNACRTALLVLDPNGDWKTKYLVLAQADNRGPGKEPSEDTEGDGDYTPSWIWIVSPGASNQPSAGDEFNHAMRVEWATTCARADRWEEEHELLLEEMGRTLLFLEWKGKQWDLRLQDRTNVSPDLRRGLVAYTTKQAAVYRRLAHVFRQQWGTTLRKLSITADWLDIGTNVSSSATVPLAGQLSTSNLPTNPPTNHSRPIRQLRPRNNQIPVTQVNSDGDDDDNVNDNNDFNNSQSDREAEEINSEDPDLDLD